MIFHELNIFQEIFDLLGIPLGNYIILHTLLQHVLFYMSWLASASFNLIPSIFHGFFHSSDDIIPVSVVPLSCLAVVSFVQVNHPVTLTGGEKLMTGGGGRLH